jgi:hypothetical protein
MKNEEKPVWADEAGEENRSQAKWWRGPMKEEGGGKKEELK